MQFWHRSVRSSRRWSVPRLFFLWGQQPGSNRGARRLGGRSGKGRDLEPSVGWGRAVTVHCRGAASAALVGVPRASPGPPAGRLQDDFPGRRVAPRRAWNTHVCNDIPPRACTRAHARLFACPRARTHAHQAYRKCLRCPQRSHLACRPRLAACHPVLHVFEAVQLQHLCTIVEGAQATHPMGCFFGGGRDGPRWLNCFEKAKVTGTRGQLGDTSGEAEAKGGGRKEGMSARSRQLQGR